MSQYDLIDLKKRKASRWRSLEPTAIITVIGLLIIAVIYLGNRQGATTRQHSVPTYRVTFTVAYEVDTPGLTGAFSHLTYTNETGNTEQKTVKLPWRLQFEAQPGQFIYVSAQAQGLGGNECKILVGGVVVEQADSSGEYSIASCSGRAE